MASRSCSPVTCVGTCANAFYFQVETAADVDQDAFGISKRSQKNYFVRSKDNKFLLLNAENQFQVQNLTIDELCKPDCSFKIQIYHDHERPGGKVKAAMLYAEIKEKNMVACCSHTQDVYPEEMEALPSRIEETSHKALFYMSTLSPSNTYMFESSVFPSTFLGFESDGDNPTLNKLVLHHKGKDEVDDSCDVILLCNK